MIAQSAAFWGFTTFVALFAFTVKKRLCCLILFGAGSILAGLYGFGIVAEQFLFSQIQVVWDTFARFGSSNLLVSLGAGSFARWLGGQYLDG